MGFASDWTPLDLDLDLELVVEASFLTDGNALYASVLPGVRIGLLVF